MSDRIWVATRKGLFALDRQSAGQWSIGEPAFLGNPVTQVLPDRRDGTLYAALNLGHFGVKLHRSDDAGKSWTECVAPSYPSAGEPQEDAKDSTPSVVQVWALESAGNGQAGHLWAGTIPGGLFHSTDRGSSWSLVESLWDCPERENWFGGGYDEPGIHSISVHPEKPDHLTVGVSCGGVWVSEDRAKSWKVTTQGMFAEYMPPERRDDPSIQDPHRLVQCPSAPDHLWVQHHNGVFRSTDAGVNWAEITAIRPAKFGFAVAVHPKDPLTAWFVPGVKDECRVPVDGALVVARTRDGGESFDVLKDGLPQTHAYDLVFRHALDVDDSGERLVMGSTTGGLWISENGGDAWDCISTHLPPVYQTRFA